MHSGHVHFEHEVGSIETTANFAIVPGLIVLSWMVLMPFQMQSQSVRSFSLCATMSTDKNSSGLIVGLHDFFGKFTRFCKGQTGVLIVL